MSWAKAVKFGVKVGKQISGPLIVYEEAKDNWKLVTDAVESAHELLFKQAKDIKRKRKRKHKKNIGKRSRTQRTITFPPRAALIPQNQAPVRQMPRFTRRRRTARRRRKSIKSKRKRTRRKSIRRRKRARVTKTSTRMVPTSQKMKFTYAGQIQVTSKPGGWGVIEIPWNTMERPLGLNQPISETWKLKWVVNGDQERQPDGYDRWMDSSTATPGTPGKYRHYRVDSASVKLTYMPPALSTSGANLVVASFPYAVLGTASGIFTGSYNEADVVPAIRKGGFFKSPKVFNSGHLGQTFGMAWSRKSADMKHPSDKVDDPDQEVLTHAGETLGDGNLVIKEGRFLIGQFGSSGDTAQILNFLITITYNVTMSNPTQFETSEDVDEVGAF